MLVHDWVLKRADGRLKWSWRYWCTVHKAWKDTVGDLVE